MFYHLCLQVSEVYLDAILLVGLFCGCHFLSCGFLVAYFALCSFSFVAWEERLSTLAFGQRKLQLFLTQRRGQAIVLGSMVCQDILVTSSGWPSALCAISSLARSLTHPIAGCAQQHSQHHLWCSTSSQFNTLRTVNYIQLSWTLLYADNSTILVSDSIGSRNDDWRKTLLLWFYLYKASIKSWSLHMTSLLYGVHFIFLWTLFKLYSGNNFSTRTLVSGKIGDGTEDISTRMFLRTQTKDLMLHFKIMACQNICLTSIWWVPIKWWASNSFIVHFGSTGSWLPSSSELCLLVFIEKEELWLMQSTNKWNCGTC